MDTLPDEVLLQILQHLSPYDLKNVTKLNSRFAQLVLEKSLWIKIDCRGQKATPEHVEFFNEQINEDTKHYMLQTSPASSIVVQPERIRKWTNYNTLTVLVLEGVDFQCEDFTLGDFPSSLIELSLDKSSFKNYMKFFRFSGRELKSLKVITLEHCLSLGDSVVMPLANFEQLEIVSLYGCMNIKDALVPLTMSTNHGFKKLKVLDARCTGLGNDLLRLAMDLPHLGELYFHCYFNFIKDQIKRRTGYVNAQNRGCIAKILQYNDFDLNSSARILDACGLNIVEHYKEQFSDEVLRYYRRATFKPQGYVPPVSMLYKRPYSACTCKASQPQQEEQSNTKTNPKHSTRTDAQPSTSTSTKCKKRPRHNSTDSDEEPHPKKYHKPGSISFQPFFLFDDGELRSPTPIPVASNDQSHRVVIEIKLFPREQPSTDMYHLVVRRRIDPDAFVGERQLSLSALSLRGSRRITDHGLDSLRQLDLDLLDVTGTKVTAAAVAAFQARKPKCRILHESKCVCRPR